MREDLGQRLINKVSLINAVRFENGLTVYKRSRDEYLSYTKDNQMIIEIYDRKLGEFTIKWKK